MKENDIVIFEPATTDIAQLSTLGQKLFVQTFEGLYSHEDLESFLNSTYSHAGLRSDMDSGCVYWAAKDVGLPESPWIGYCKAGPVKIPIPKELRINETKDASHNSQAIELRQLYIERSYHRRGIGARFMKKFLQLCAQRKIELLYVSCWSGNVQALTFYQNFGFAVIGQYDFPVGNHRDIEFILQRTC